MYQNTEEVIMNLVIRIGIVLLVLIAVVWIHIGGEPKVEPIIKEACDTAPINIIEQKWYPTPAPIIKFEDNANETNNHRRAW